MEYYNLRNGVKLSAIGLGTYPMRPDQLIRVIPKLKELGVNLIDTAHDYQNERWIGIANKFNKKQKLLISTKISVGQQKKREILGDTQKRFSYRALIILV